MRTLKILIIALPVAVVLLIVGMALSEDGVPIPAPARHGTWPLYAGGAPSMAGAARSENWDQTESVTAAHNVTEPTLEPFLPEPDKATGTAVVIAPGGASVALAINIEGWDVAHWFARQGVAAFVLKYRTRPMPVSPFLRVPWSLLQLPGMWKNGKLVLPPFQPAVDDGMAAIRLLRARAGEFGIDPKRIGLVGFSAGAITTLAVVQQAGAQSRPSFAGMIYGPLDTAVPPAQPPPLFIAIAGDDPFARNTDHGLVPAWKKAGAPVEFHQYPSGGHGFGLGKKGTDTVQWPEQFMAWLQANRLLTGKANSGAVTSVSQRNIAARGTGTDSLK